MPRDLDRNLEQVQAADLRRYQQTRNVLRIRRDGVSTGRFAIVVVAGPSSLGARPLAGILLLVLIAAAVYLGSCIPWPYGPCLSCRAHPRRNHGSTGRRHGRCRVCKGTGERLRAGTRLLLAWTGGRVPKGIRR
jgi:hypothetical protein